MNLMVTSGHNRSLHTIALLHRLINDGHSVSGVLMVNTFRFKRLKSYWRQYGMRTIVAKFRSHFLHQGGTYLERETAPIKTYNASNNISSTTVKDFCRDNGIPLIPVDRLSSDVALNACHEVRPGLIIYSGGGIVRQSLIDGSEHGVLNAHSGPLPKIRGMNGIEWSVIKGMEPTTTVHFIDSGIDTGNVVFAEPIPVEDGDDLYDIRGKATVHNISLISKIVLDFDTFTQHAKAQKKSEGKQYFVMHDMMKEVVQQRLGNR